MIGDFDRRKRYKRGKAPAKKVCSSMQAAWLEFCAVQRANGIKPMPDFVVSQMKTFFVIGYMPAALSGYKAMISLCEKLADQVMEATEPEEAARLSRSLCALAEEAGMAIKETLAEYKRITDKTQQDIDAYHASMDDLRKKCEKLSQN